MTSTFERARGTTGEKGPPGAFGLRDLRRFMAEPLPFLDQRGPR